MDGPTVGWTERVIELLTAAKNEVFGETFSLSVILGGTKTIFLQNDSTQQYASDEVSTNITLSFLKP